MRTKIALLFALAFSSIFVVDTTYADSMRCGTHLIGDGGWRGPSMYEVLKKCGEPTYRNGNTWVYESSTKSRKVLRFNREGLLVKLLSK